ncbi:neuroendocrine protein 7B2 precursor (Secretogranin v) domain-containing protein [Ditylenchus destructor]|nr:neuroendocrine protein 7B2 precursor (Secretogranin v) domain-containing protein [Ditylenchus destructor]
MFRLFSHLNIQSNIYGAGVSRWLTQDLALFISTLRTPLANPHPKYPPMARQTKEECLFSAKVGLRRQRTDNCGSKALSPFFLLVSVWTCKQQTQLILGMPPTCLLIFSVIIGSALGGGSGLGIDERLMSSANMEFSQPLFPDSEFIDLISRDAESFPGPLSFGHKYITEGDQQLRPEDEFAHREQVKSDNVLPAYCEPPNPCPVGYADQDGCLEDFENSAEFSRNYQSQQQCLCDQEHMFNCPSKNTQEEYEENLEDMLSKNGLHKSMIAKKFHETRMDEPRRRKRSVPASAGRHHERFNPYLGGEPLHSMSKKDGRNIGRNM